MARFSFFSLARNALTGHQNWPEQWRSPEPKPAYDAVIIGAGGHGLATAYYMAKEHKMTNIAVIEKGWLGGGNTGATPPSSVRTISMTRAPVSMSMRSSSGKGCPRS